MILIVIRPVKNGAASLRILAQGRVKHAKSTLPEVTTATFGVR